MSRHTRLLLLAGVVVLAGCSAGGLGETLPTETPDDSGTVAASHTPVRVGGTGLDALEPSATLRGSVADVVDGDTVRVRLADGTTDTVRLVGVDTPEVHAENRPREYEGVPDSAAGARCLRGAGRNASAFLAARLDGAAVTLAFDRRTDRRGDYDRLLAYVYVDGENLNHELVAAGHARVYESAFTFREEFTASETRARSAGRGLWACATRG
jgi:micrococcal nuclease